MSVHHYTLEEQQFFKTFVPGHSYKEIQEAFVELFGWDISISQIRGCIRRYKLNTGRSGYYCKGKQSQFKGMKGLRIPGSEKGWFKKGNIPHNHKPIGSERIRSDGYIEVKIAEPNKWRLKHVFVWENNNGTVPNDSCVIFLDGNKQNIDLNNLLLIKRKTLVRMNQKGLFYNDPEHTLAGVKIAEISNAIGDARRKIKGCECNKI